MRRARRLLAGAALIASAGGCTVYAVSLRPVESDGPPRVELLSRFAAIDEVDGALRISVPVRAPVESDVVRGCIEPRAGALDSIQEQAQRQGRPPIEIGAFDTVAQTTADGREVLIFERWRSEAVVGLDSATLHVAAFASVSAANTAQATGGCAANGRNRASVIMRVESANQTLAALGGLGAILILIVGVAG